MWTISAGNAGQGVAYAARRAGVPCTVVAIETAPTAKIERMKALGAKLILVPFATAWKALEERAYPGAEGTFVHPFDDHQFIAGHGTMGLEILEDAPDTAAIIAAHRRRRAHHRSRQRREGAPAGHQGLGGRAGDGRAPVAFARRRFAAGVPGVEGRPSSTAPAARASSRACGSG